MFQITVKEVIQTPLYDYLHIVGIDAIGDVKVGDKITDGKSVYKITAIPFIRHNKSRLPGEIDICISKTSDNLVGKTLYALEIKQPVLSTERETEIA